jgi:hypothetical protein
MAFMLPVFTREETRKMQDGKHPRTGVKLFIFSWIFESQDTRENGFNRWRRQATREPRRKGTLLHCSGREVNGGCSEEALKVDVPHVVDRGSGTEPLRLLPYPLPPRAVYLVGSEDDPRAKQRDLLTRDSHPGCILCIAFAHFTRGDAAGGPLGLHRRPGLAISSTISQVVPHRWLGVGL